MLSPAGGLASQAKRSKQAPRPAGLVASLAASRLAPAQAAEIGLSYEFKRPSKHFSYLLERRQNAGWVTLHSVKLRGRFKGTRNSSVQKIFGRVPVTQGSYRLRLSSDGSRVTLKFSVFAAVPITDVSSVSGGGMLTCVLISTRGAECWGDNGEGELGNGTVASSTTAVTVSGVNNAISISSGYKSACVLLGSGTISCWGYNSGGELGNGTNTNSSLPVAVSGLSGVIAAASGAAHNCALITGGTLECWGDNEEGQLGTGSLSPHPPYGSSTPLPVSAVSNVVGVTAGFLHTCALIEGGTVECWGYNHDGQIGNGTTNSVRPYADPAPAQVTGITNAVSLSAGDFHTCALLAGGRVSCWGFISASDIGPDVLLNSAVPKLVPGISNAVAISSGGLHTCALLSGGTVKCWGEDQYGQLGNGKTLDSSSPVAVIGIKNAVAIGSGGFHSCAVLSGGGLKCWGRNDSGQLGIGTLTASSVPVTAVHP